MAPLALVLAGCTAGEPDVVLVVVDTLRADYLGIHGYTTHPTSPAIDAFSEGALVFERAYAPAPWTLPSMGTILSGQAPRQNGLRTRLQDLPASVETLAERYQALGYSTCAVVSTPLMESTDGFRQGFDRYETSPAHGGTYVSGSEVTELALGCLDEWGPTFAFIHYFDPHDPYIDHADIAFASGAETLTGTEKTVDLRAMRHELGPADVAYLRALYAEEVRYTDEVLAPLLAELDDDDAFVLTSDHGEDLMDHGWIGHQKHLYEESVRVPLIVRIPGLGSGRNTSVTPIAHIAEALLGSPEVLLSEDDALLEIEHRLRGAEDIDLSGVVRGSDKQIRDAVGGTEVRFDLSADPGELQPLDARPELAEAIDAYNAIQPADVVDVAQQALRERQLQALGYMESE